jgi:hypothetical protein
MSFQNISLNEDEQRNRAYAALLAPPKKPVEIDYSKEILAELKKMNDLMKVQISLLKDIRNSTGKTLCVQEEDVHQQATGPR